jgi:hypothetical protein
MKFNLTIVSAFMTNIHKSKGREQQKYIDMGNKLIALRIPKVIFIESEICKKYYNHIEYKDELTKFVYTNKTDSYLYEYIDKLSNYDTMMHDKGDANTIENMFTQCNKTEWIRRAINFNYYDTTQYMWMDFGIYKQFMHEEIFNEAVQKMSEKSYNDVRIACIDSLISPIPSTIYNLINFTFAGSIFGGNKLSLLKFADIMKIFCIQIMEEKKTLMWEINIWKLIYKQHKSLFDTYYANYNNISLISNY